MIPAIIIGGYLGAGKTTLVNHLLRQAGGRRIAVLVNDFGELSIDADLIEGADGAVLALAGGCVCCSYGDDLVGALRQCAARDPAPDIMLIETSGVGMPAAVARSAKLAGAVKVEGIVVMADGQNLQARAQDRYVGELVRQQLHEANLSILNKSDLLAPEALESLRAWLARQAPQGRVLVAAQAQVPPDLILGLQAADRQENAQDALARWASPAPRQGGAADLFMSETRTFGGPVDLAELARELTSHDSGVLRAKGLLTDLDGQRRLLQIVGDRADITPAPVQSQARGPDHLLLIRLARDR